MRFRLITVWLYTFIIIGLLALPGSVWADRSYSLTGPAAAVHTGNSFAVTLTGELPNEPRSYEMVLTYDHELLELAGSSSELAGAWYSVGPKDKNNKTHLGFIISSEPGDWNNVDKISSLTFKAKSPGKAQIVLESLNWYDSDAILQQHTVNKALVIDIRDEEKDSAPDPGPSSDIPSSLTLINGRIMAKSEWVGGQAVSTVSMDVLEEVFNNAQPDADGVKEAVIRISSIDHALQYVLQLPAGILTSTGKDRRIQVETPIGKIIIPAHMLKGIDTLGQANIGILIGKADKSVMGKRISGMIGKRPVIELQVLAGNEVIPWNNMNAPVTVSLDYEPTPEERKDMEHLSVWHIQDQDEAIPLPNGKFNSNTHQIVFHTTHFSKFAVVFVKKGFDDLSEFPWAQKEIEVLASKGIINGASENAYMPGAPIKRADFLLLLVRSLELSAAPAGSFDDVKPTDYYYDALGTAKALGLAEGQEDNIFNPEQLIVRQDMMVLIDRALKIVNKLAVEGKPSELEPYSDARDISDYAVHAASAMLKAGLIEGDGSRLKPLDDLTRAEAAVIIYRMYHLKNS
jgi:hypothetical protein